MVYNLSSPEEIKNAQAFIHACAGNGEEVFLYKPEGVITRAGQMVRWYNKNSSKATVEQLMEAHDKLAGYAYRMAEVGAIGKRDYNMKNFVKTVHYNKQKQRIMESKKTTATAAKAIVISTDEYMEKYRLETDAEAFAYECDVLLKQANKVLSAMMQRVSFMKSERERQKYLENG